MTNPTLAAPQGKYPAKEHARRVAATYKEQTGAAPAGRLYLAGTKATLHPYSDQGPAFHQDRYFNYLSGAFDVVGAHVLYDAKADRLVLYLPPVDEDDIMWSGLPLSPEQARERFDVDDVKYSADLRGDFAGERVLGIEPSAEFAEVVADKAFLEALDETRVYKDAYEQALLRRAAAITDVSHRAVMSALPIETNEGHIHAEFVYHSMRQGAKLNAYDPICCAGTNAGTLHYVKNDEDIDADRLLVLIDAGAEWQLYAADVTRVFPINGHWTPECRAIYELVREMQSETMALVRPGAQWEDLHLLAHRILIRGFLRLGIFKNGTEDEIFESNLSAAFFPHGLGHMLGMNTHDTAGHADYSDPDPKLRYLRIRRKLAKDMYVTVEPGCYFNEFLLKPHLEVAENSRFLDHDVLKRYMPVGGVRIEDDVLVTADGYENFTKITSDPDEVAAIVREGISKGRSHFHNLA